MNDAPSFTKILFPICQTKNIFTVHQHNYLKDECKKPDNHYFNTGSAIALFSIDMYLPGFPAIGTDLNTSIEMVSYFPVKDHVVNPKGPLVPLQQGGAFIEAKKKIINTQQT